MRACTTRHRRLVASGLLIAYAFAATGLPLRVPTIAKRATAERYPCESCGCGCSTAAGCWGNCCCFTPSQRLAWAKNEGVRPPEFALDAAEKAGIDVSVWRPWTRPTNAEATVCKRAGGERRACCCVAKSAPVADDDKPEDDPLVPSFRSFACGGSLLAWLSLGVVAFEPPVEHSIELLTVTRAIPLCPRAESPALCPEPPPPERC